ncbi:TolC family outer membrane protein [Limnohabitans sp. 2KL-17]|uniref:TolC family outer membrane protein n=1 Tax=Limnohabitans sp. 2KL-17 TaxID=1100704 RepID=UPI001E2C886E|nr:TolC family outer membrane protein [Limnohabitans sp. 2KL-17]
MNMMISRMLLAGTVLAICATAASATDLLQVWEAARQHDPQGAVNQASRAAGATRHEQAAALWRPNLGLSATGGWSNAQSQMNGAQFAMPGSAPVSGASFGTSIHGGNATRWALNAKQALYNPERRAQSAQLGMAAQASEHEWQLAQQDWMLLTTKRYFDVVQAERRLVLLLQQQQAVDKALTEAKDRFALGDAPVTDTHEAQARAQALGAQAIAAGNDLDMARQVLAEVTGLPIQMLTLQAPSRPGVAMAAEPVAIWLQRAEQNNPMLKLQQAQATAAQFEIDKHRASASPTLDLVAQASRDRLSGSGDFGVASNTQSQQMVDVMLNVPLYSGGMRSARLQEAMHLHDKALAELARSRQQVSQMTRAAWLAVHSGQARLAALNAARTASQARLASTQLGRQVGDRTTLDLLNAQNDASAAEWSWLQAQIDTLMAQLRLDAMAGQLGLQQLEAVNAALKN